MWSLNPKEWAHADFWVAKRKFRRRFLTRNDIELIPDTPGVYLIVARPSSAQSELLELRNVMYVGKSENLKQRFSQHSGTSAKPHIRELVHFFGPTLEFWFTELSAEKIAEVESALIRCFKPQANTQGIPGRLKAPISL